MRIIHFVTVFSNHDGIGGIIRGLHCEAQRLGYESIVVAGKVIDIAQEPHILVDPNMVKAKAYLSDSKSNESFYIYHFGVYDSAIDQFFTDEATFNRIFYYHNITPASFYRGWENNIFRITEHSRAVLKNLLKGEWIVTGDSQFNIDEIRALNFSSHKFLPPVMASSANEGDFRPRLSASFQSQPRLLFTGRIAPNKRQDVLIFLLKYLKQRGIKAELILVGRREGVYSIYVWLIAKIMGVADQVIYRKGLSPHELLACYRYADFFVVASEHEGFCVPVIEALANGCFTIARPFGAVGELLKNTKGLVAGQDIFSFFAKTYELMMKYSEDSKMYNTDVKEVIKQLQINTETFWQPKKFFLELEATLSPVKSEKRIK